MIHKIWWGDDFVLFAWFTNDNGVQRGKKWIPKQFRQVSLVERQHTHYIHTTHQKKRLRIEFLILLSFPFSFSLSFVDFLLICCAIALMDSISLWFALTWCDQQRKSEYTEHSFVADQFPSTKQPRKKVAAINYLIWKLIRVY